MADRRRGVNLPADLMVAVDEAVELHSPLFASSSEFVKQAVVEKLRREHPRYRDLMPKRDADPSTDQGMAE